MKNGGKERIRKLEKKEDEYKILKKKYIIEN